MLHGLELCSPAATFGYLLDCLDVVHTDNIQSHSLHIKKYDWMYSTKLVVMVKVLCRLKFSVIDLLLSLLLQLLLSKDGVFIHVTTAQADEDVLLPGQVFIWSKV